MIYTVWGGDGDASALVPDAKLTRLAKSTLPPNAATVDESQSK